MSTVLATILVILALMGIGFICLVVWLRNKTRRTIAWLKVQGLAEGLKELQKKKDETPAGQEADAELIALLARVETAHGKAKTAFDSEDWNGVNLAADDVLPELFDLLQEKIRKEQEAHDAQSAAARIETQPALPAPDAAATDEGTKDKQ